MGGTFLCLCVGLLCTETSESNPRKVSRRFENPEPPFGDTFTFEPPNRDQLIAETIDLVSVDDNETIFSDNLLEKNMYRVVLLKCRISV